MEYERESSRTSCSVVPNCSEVGEGVFIVSLEIWPLQLDTSAFSSRNLVNRVWGWATRCAGQSDRARGRTVRSIPDLAPGRDRGRTCRSVHGPQLPPVLKSVLTGAPGPQPGLAGRGTGRSAGQAPGEGKSPLDCAPCAPVQGPVGAGLAGAMAGLTGPVTGLLLRRPSLFLTKWGVYLFLFVPLIHHYAYLANTWE